MYHLSFHEAEAKHGLPEASAWSFSQRPHDETVSQGWGLMWRSDWWRILFQAPFCGSWEIQLLGGCWTEGLHSLLAIGWRPPSVPHGPFLHVSLCHQSQKEIKSTSKIVVTVIQRGCLPDSLGIRKSLAHSGCFTFGEFWLRVSRILM